MGSKKCFNAKKFFFLFFPEYLPLILGVPINVEVPNPNFRGTYPPEYHFFSILFLNPSLIIPKLRSQSNTGACFKVKSFISFTFIECI